jgi:hypothetical protein
LKLIINIKIDSQLIPSVSRPKNRASGKGRGSGLGFCRPRASRGVLVLAVLAAFSACACGSPSGENDDSTGSQFIAFASDFAHYKQWTSYSYTNDGGTVHNSGPRTEYINHLPPAGAKAFPVGTIIVKDIKSQDPNMFAMVKRGGGYNSGGAAGWEWFELVQDTPLRIQWRGFGPPAGETYGGDPTACNDCHRAATDNDSVLSPKIRLSGP